MCIRFYIQVSYANILCLYFNVCIHRSTYLYREYVVDLVGEPGNVHGPDSSINGTFLSPMPSPLRISHLKEFQQPYLDAETTCLPIDKPLHSGIKTIIF